MLARAIALQGIGYSAPLVAVQGFRDLPQPAGELAFAGGFPTIWHELIRDGLPDYDLEVRAALTISARSAVEWQFDVPGELQTELVTELPGKQVAKLPESLAKPSQRPQAAPFVWERADAPGIEIVRRAGVQIAIAAGVKAEFEGVAEARAEISLGIDGGSIAEFDFEAARVRERQMRVIAALIAAGEL